MAEAILFSIVEDLLKIISSGAIDEMSSAWGFKAELKKLKNTVNTIKDVLLDAEERQVESHFIRRWLERLKSVVYDADDLFDEFATVASRNEQLGSNKLKKEVKIFISNFNQITFPFTISKKIKKIRKQIDDIVTDGHKFAFVLQPYKEQGLVCRQQRDQSYSFVVSEEVIGRGNDKKVILDRLLASSDKENVSVVPIVGIGGLGKTTLAQFIYNDEQVEKHFELRLWVCVSDIFDVKEIAKKIITSATNAEPQILQMDQLQSRLRNEIGGKKYLLVLDDVWNEDREKWVKLRDLLRIGREGSKILVTTRSRRVAEVMDGIPHELEGLSEEKSWTLFKKMAFEPGQEGKNPKLVEAGKEIVKKCANVPLAIRTLGSLLYRKDESKWMYIKNRSLAQLSEQANDVMSILKYSYHHLWSPLKNCFAYCALFPRDHELRKETLINLWMAEGFLIPADGQSLEDAGEEYFLTLLQRCFFQNIKKDEFGNITSFKMHDLIHQLALEVAGAESKIATIGERDFVNTIRHLSFGYRLTSSHTMPSCMVSLTNLRTILLPGQINDGSNFGPICDQLMSKFRCLRVLDLNNLEIEALPSSIGKLCHLRYLNLSRTSIKTLPKSIKELRNLQTLDLGACRDLEWLPTGLTKLINLRSLNLFRCSRLIRMPSGIGVLTSLQKLSVLVVNNRDFPASRFKPTSAQLTDLKTLSNFRGILHIKFLGELKDPVFEAKEANLSNKPGLLELYIQGDSNLYKVNRGSEHDEAVLEGLKPHPNLKKLEIASYRGQKLPSWAVMENLSTSLPNLVQIVLFNCGNCEQLPVFGQLPFLKRLCLTGLGSAEYMETSIDKLPSSPEGTIFFPSLQLLKLYSMTNLKGWWKEEGIVVSHNQQAQSVPTAAPTERQQHLSGMSFSCLIELVIANCPNLTSMPLCPNVKNLTLLNISKNLHVLKMATTASAASTSSSASSEHCSTLQKLVIDNVEDLFSLPKECLHHLYSLAIRDDKLVSTSRLREVCTSLSSLRLLCFADCSSLRSFSGWLEELTALEELLVWNCLELDLSPNEGMEDGTPWIALKSLQTLKFYTIRQLLALPTAFQHLTSLRHLELRYMDGLEELPEWISCFSSLASLSLYCCLKLTLLPEGFRELTSLNILEIIGCPGLTKRCRGPSGEDYPKIQHIPLLVVRENRES